MTVRQDQDAHYASTKVSEFSGVMSVTVCQDMADSVGSMLEALNLVVVTIVICAGMLAVTVLYNLTNINITERIREIATIKVLGFRAGESAAYVFKENLLLTAMGMVFGLFLGKWLLDFVISQIKIDMIWLTTSIQPMSCLYAVLLTMLSAVIVDFVLYFKLEKINMAEALKSVE
jgi:putative ABC transport system permease protein